MLRTLPITATPSDLSSTLEFISSDATLDRYHEIIDPAGWRLSTYQKNPVFQNAHNHDNIIHTLGRALITEVRQVNGRPALYQKIQFATDANPIARIAYSLYKGQFLNAVSVGFLPIRWQDNVEQASSPAGSGGVSPPVRRVHLEQELLEVSAVSIPANPNALALASKSGALDKSDLKETADLLQHLINDRPPPPPLEQTSILNQLHEIRSLLKHL